MDLPENFTHLSSSPSPPDFAFQTGKPYKVHKSYIWAGPLLAVGAVILVVLANGASGWVQLIMAINSGEISVNLVMVIGAIILGMVLIWAAITGIYALNYKYMSYVFDPAEFSWYSGIFVKKRVHVPYEKVQSVNQRASLLQRILGVCSVTIDSAGGSSNRGVRIPYVTLADAERMRSDLFARKAAAAIEAHREAPGATGAGAQNLLDDAFASVGTWRGAFGGEDAATEAVSFEYALSNKELILASISHPAPLVVGLCVALGLAITAIFALTQDDLVSLFMLTFAVPVVIVATLVSWVIGCGVVALSYGGFKVRRRGSRIEVERGLLTRNVSGIDVNRIQSLDLRQSLLRRLLGYSEITLGRIDSQGQNQKDQKNTASVGLLIQPCIARGNLESFLAGLLPEYHERPRREACAPLPKPALGRNLRRRCLWFNWMLWVIVGALLLWLCILALVALDEGLYFEDVQELFMVTLAPLLGLAAGALGIYLTVVIPSAVLWAKHSCYGWTNRFLLLHNDGLGTHTTIVPRQKIQSGSTKDNPFQRRAALTTLRVQTAAGVHQTTTKLLDVSAVHGEEFLSWLE